MRNRSIDVMSLKSVTSLITHSNDLRNRFTGSLNDLLQVGKAMDMSSMFEVPIEMLAFLEGDVSNPELYQYKLYEDAEARATAFAERVLYLQVMAPTVSPALITVLSWND